MLVVIEEQLLVVNIKLDFICSKEKFILQQSKTKILAMHVEDTLDLIYGVFFHENTRFEVQQPKLFKFML